MRSYHNLIIYENDPNCNYMCLAVESDLVFVRNEYICMHYEYITQRALNVGTTSKLILEQRHNLI